MRLQIDFKGQPFPTLIFTFTIRIPQERREGDLWLGPPPLFSFWARDIKKGYPSNDV